VQGQSGAPSVQGLKVFSMETLEEVEVRVGPLVVDINTSGSITSMTLSPDSQHILLSLTNQELQEWPLQSLLAGPVQGMLENSLNLPCQIYRGMAPRPARHAPLHAVTHKFLEQLAVFTSFAWGYHAFTCLGPLLCCVPVLLQILVVICSSMLF
jgi:hypothetical protein